jgi:hypothetical protein
MIETINISDIDQLEIPKNDNIILKILNITFLIILILILIALVIYRKKYSNLKYYKPILTMFTIIALITFYNIANTKKTKPQNNKITNLLNSINDDNYKILEINNFLSEQECDDLIEYSKTQTLVKSRVLSETGDVESDNRDSEQIWLEDNKHYVVTKIANLSAKITQKPLNHMEYLQFLKYNKGGYFKEHYDPEINYKSDTNDRIYTIIIYLNDDFEGGETYFKNINISIKPKKGKAVIFKSLDENGNILKKSLHQGSEVTSGTKYMCNKWIHLNKCNWLYLS